MNEAVGAVESRFNHVIKVVNTLSLQHILESVGFTTFKLRHVGRWAPSHSSDPRPLFSLLSFTAPFALGNDDDERNCRVPA